MRIWIDADATPREVKDLVFRATQRLGLPAVLVANRRLQPPDGYPHVPAVRVDGGPDAADQHIATVAHLGDLVVTQDIPLAALLVPKGIAVLDPRGDEHTTETIGERLSWDGQWLYFRNGGLWKMPATGGKAIQITKEFNADRPQESPDGKTVYYAVREMWPMVSLRKMPVAGGERIKVIDSVKMSWVVERQGILYFSPSDGKGSEELRVYNFATGTVRKILSVDRPADGPSVSPDGRSIIYQQQDQAGSDLMLLENFR